MHSIFSASVSMSLNSDIYPVKKSHPLRSPYNARALVIESGGQKNSLIVSLVGEVF
jgi:hypothetical protein